MKCNIFKWPCGAFWAVVYARMFQESNQSRSRRQEGDGRCTPSQHCLPVWKGTWDSWPRGASPTNVPWVTQRCTGCCPVWIFPREGSAWSRGSGLLFCIHCVQVLEDLYFPQDPTQLPNWGCSRRGSVSPLPSTQNGDTSFFFQYKLWSSRLKEQVFFFF